MEIDTSRSSAPPQAAAPAPLAPIAPAGQAPLTRPRNSHLRALEDEAIFIMREVAAQAERPVLMYSIGKDSSVLLHLARKAFFPGRLPFPLLHIDTTWKFREMIAFRDETARRHGLDLRVHTNQDGLKRGVNPFDFDAGLYTQVMKTDALRQALTEGKYDFAIGGARRDEERSRAKERVFSMRAPGHVWDPKRQRPELWHLFNGRLSNGETMRVFPLSNWTEIDVWLYILAEQIPIVPLYFAAERPTVERDGVLIVCDDERMRYRDGEQPVPRRVRFRSLGCYPLSAAVLSEAASVEDIVAEMKVTRVSERAGRLIDHDTDSSMEKKKREGYF